MYSKYSIARSSIHVHAGEYRYYRILCRVRSWLQIGGTYLSVLHETIASGHLKWSDSTSTRGDGSVICYRQGVRALGIDFGLARVGVAHCEEGLSLALPLFTVQVGHLVTPEAIAKAVALRVADKEAQEVVVGLPLHLRGVEGASAEKARAFAAALEQELGARIIFWDERLSTKSAERELRSHRRGKKLREVIDQAVAVRLLQSYLDSRTSHAPWLEEEPELEALHHPPAQDARRRRGGRGRLLGKSAKGRGRRGN